MLTSFGHMLFLVANICVRCAAVHIIGSNVVKIIDRAIAKIVGSK